MVKLVGGNKLYPAHRISYIIFKGLIPENDVIRHTCDNPLCMNPNHLISGTQHENLVDAVKRSRHPNQILNEECVKVIKWMLKYRYKYGLVKKLAKLHEVHISTISNIKKGKTWSFVIV